MLDVITPLVQTAMVIICALPILAAGSFLMYKWTKDWAWLVVMVGFLGALILSVWIVKPLRTMLVDFYRQNWRMA